MNQWCQQAAAVPRSPGSKYDRLIVAAKGVPTVSTIVVHPCDESSLRGAIESAEAGNHQAILVGPVGQDQGCGRQAQAEHFGLRDRRHAANRGGGRHAGVWS